MRETLLEHKSVWWRNVFYFTIVYFCDYYRTFQYRKIVKQNALTMRDFSRNWIFSCLSVSLGSESIQNVVAISFCLCFGNRTFVHLYSGFFRKQLSNLMPVVCPLWMQPVSIYAIFIQKKYINDGNVYKWHKLPLRGTYQRGTNHKTCV